MCARVCGEMKKLRSWVLLMSSGSISVVVTVVVVAMLVFFFWIDGGLASCCCRGVIRIIWMLVCVVYEGRTS